MNSQISSDLPPPGVLVFFCERCCGHKSALAGLALKESSESLSSVHFKCAREVTTAQIRHGFAGGADGILIFGCLVRDCESGSDNLAVLQDLFRNQVTVKNLGLPVERLREEWVVQGTTDHFAEVLADFVGQLVALGPRPAADLKAEAGEA